MIRLCVNRGGSLVTELRFDEGPVYIGRKKGSQVFLPELTVSRRHAVISSDEDGNWTIEDLASANKTFLNNKEIHQSQINDGDVIEIAGFSIEFHIEEDQQAEAQQQQERQEEPIYMEDTVAAVKHDVNTVVRQLTTQDAPPISIPTRRVKDFCQATRAISKAGTLKELHSEFVGVILRQFSALHPWVGLRRSSEGPMEFEGGRMITTKAVQRADLIEQKAIKEALAKHKYILVPQLPRAMSDGNIRSVIVAPVLRDNKCYGIAYAENSTKHEHYGMSDLDYLMLLSIHVAVAIENLQ